MADVLPVPPAIPCVSCPFRCDVPSGVWETDEYAKLPDYDGPMHVQSPALFMCHQRNGHLCSGWLGFRDPDDLLAIRIASAYGHVDPAVLDYRAAVALFPSGQAAHDHGVEEHDDPGDDANRLIASIQRKQDCP